MDILRIMEILLMPLYILKRQANMQMLMKANVLYVVMLIRNSALQILEAKMVNEYGKFTRVRKVSPVEWYNQYQEKILKNIKLPEIIEKQELPSNKFKIPSKFRQFKIFCHQKYYFQN